MSCKGSTPKRPLVVNPTYGLPVAIQSVDRVLLDGKKSTAERIVHGVLEGVRPKTDQGPVSVLRRAPDSIRPALEVRSCRAGDATHQMPAGVRLGYATTLALRWFVGFPRQCRENTMIERLISEILGASNGLDATIRRREDMYRMAELNEAFAYYRQQCRNQLHTPHE